MNRGGTWSDFKMEQIIGNLLRTGVLIAVAFVFAGAVIYLIRHSSEMPAYHVFRGEPSALTSFTGSLGEARTLSGRGVIQVGLFLLVLTPIARVVFSLVGFLIERDRLYVVVTFIVLIILLLSFTNHLP